MNSIKMSKLVLRENPWYKAVISLNSASNLFTAPNKVAALPVSSMHSCLKNFPSVLCTPLPQVDLLAEVLLRSSFIHNTLLLPVTSVQLTAEVSECFLSLSFFLPFL